jgi:hypothetical protein
MSTFNWPVKLGSLSGLSDTNITEPVTDDSILRYDSGSSKWINQESKSLTETTSNVLTITGGAKAVLDDTTIEVQAASNTVPGYLNPDEYQHILKSTHTSLEEDGLVTTASATTVDIEAGSGIIVNSYSDIFDPVETDISWNAETGVTDNYVATDFATWFLKNSSGTTIQQNFPMTAEQRRDFIWIGQTLHPNGSIICSLPNTNIISADVGQTVQDFFWAVGPINISGNVYSANGTNLNIDKSLGTGLGLGQNYRTNSKDPNTVSLAAESPCADGIYSYRDGIGGWIRNATASPIVIDPTKYDDGSGTLASMITSKFSIQRIYLAKCDETTNIHAIQYGQSFYNSISDAQAFLTSDDFETDPIFGTGLGRCYLIVKGDATDLSDTGQAKFIIAGKFGFGSSAGAATSTTDLQTAYNNSVQPQIELTSAAGALQIIDAATPLGTNLFEVQNNAQTSDYFSVATAGIKAQNLDVVAAGAMAIGASVGANDLTLGGATSTVVSAGDLSVDTGKQYEVNKVKVLDATSLGTGVLASSLTSVGTLSSLAISGDLTVDTDTFKVDSTNNRVGVGTSIPTTQLEVSDAGATNIRATNSSASKFIQMGAGASDTYHEYTTAYRLVDGVGTRLTIDSSGNVGLGTSSPVTQFEVEGSATVVSITDTRSYVADQDAGVISFRGTSGVSGEQSLAQIRGKAPPAGINNAGQLAFFTRKSGVLNETVRIDEDGRVGFGKAPSVSGSTIELNFTTADVAYLDGFTGSSMTAGTLDSYIKINIGGSRERFIPAYDSIS